MVTLIKYLRTLNTQLNIVAPENLPSANISKRPSKSQGSYHLTAKASSRKSFAPAWRNGPGGRIKKMLEKRRDLGVRNPYLICTDDGRNLTRAIFRIRFDGACKPSAKSARGEVDRTKC